MTRWPSAPFASSTIRRIRRTPDGALAETCECCEPTAPPCFSCPECRCKTTPIRMKIIFSGITLAGPNDEVGFCNGCANQFPGFFPNLHGNPNKSYIYPRGTL